MSDSTQSTSRARSGATDWQGWIGKVIEAIPVFGKPLKLIWDMPAGGRRLAVILLAALVIYPVFVVFGVLGAVQVLPDAPRGAVQRFLLASAGVKQEEQRFVEGRLNKSNLIIDGSMPMLFNLDANGQAPDRYYQVIDRGQAVSFQTYQRHASRALKNDACAAADPPDDVTIGYLLVRVATSGYAKEFPVVSSFDGLSEAGVIDSDEWKRINAKKSGADAVQFLLSFRPEPQFVNSTYFQCNSVAVYMNMTFKKLNF